MDWKESREAPRTAKSSVGSKARGAAAGAGAAATALLGAAATGAPPVSSAGRSHRRLVAVQFCSGLVDVPAGRRKKRTSCATLHGMWSWCFVCSPGFEGAFCAYWGSEVRFHSNPPFPSLLLTPYVPLLSATPTPPTPRKPQSCSRRMARPTASHPAAPCSSALSRRSARFAPARTNWRYACNVWLKHTMHTLLSDQCPYSFCGTGVGSP